MSKSRACLATVTAAVVSLSVLTAIIRTGPPAQAAAAAPSGPNPGTATLTSGWRIQTSAVAGHDGARISEPGYRAAGWLPLSEPETLMAGLLETAATRTCSSATAWPTVPAAQFRATGGTARQLELHPAPRPAHVPDDERRARRRANLWVNGRKVADRSQLQGAYSRFEYDITASCATAPTPSPSTSARTTRATTAT